MDLTPVYVTPEEAHLFVQFQKHYALMGLLENIGAFKLRSGSVTLHFNNGIISSVDKEEHYRV